MVKRRLFFIKPEEAGAEVVHLSEGETHHAVSVMRIKNGGAVDLFDGKGGRFKGVAVGVKDRRLAVRLQKTEKDESRPGVSITLAAAVIKPDRMEWLIEKACELGVERIAPVLTERSVVRLSRERWDSKIKRWRKIALETCKQCGRDVLPEVEAVQDFKFFMASAVSYDRILIPTLEVGGRSLGGWARSSKPERILVLIGPEGDFTKREVEFAMTHGAVPVSLGPSVLRSETAALYVLSALNSY